jgi:hypothetical protein
VPSIPPHPELLEKIRIEADYFNNNKERMRYPKFRSQHLFIGSGVIEAGCKTIIGSRCKQSGMLWIVCGANAIMALRCCLSTRGLRITGRAERRPDFHFHVAYPLVQGAHQQNAILSDALISGLFLRLY